MYHPSEGFSSPEVEQFLKRASATALILMRGEKVLSRAGKLCPEGFQQLADVLNRYWPVSPMRKRDRYVALSLSGRYHFVIAKRTPVLGHLLGLAFPLQTPLVRIRQDMTDLLSLVHAFEVKQLDDDAGLEQSLQLHTQSTSSPDLSPDSNAVPDGWQMEIKAPGQFEDEPVPEQPIAEPGSDDGQTKGALQYASSFAPPIYPGNDLAVNSGEVVELAAQDSDPCWQPLESLVPPEPMPEPDDLTLADGLESRFNHQTSNQRRKSWHPLDVRSTEGEDLASMLQEDFAIRREQPIVEEQQRATATTPEEPIYEIPHWDSEATKPVSRKVTQVSLADTVFDTTFYLVPRLKQHYLLGELVHHLREWLPRLCEVYGWQLDFLSVRPDYLKWTLGDFPECLTRKMLGVVRRVTSEQIFRVFPALLAGNPTQDFWSPGYLLDTQNREFPTQVLIAHVSKDRSDGYQPDFEML